MSADPSLRIRPACEADMAACAGIDAKFPTHQYYDLAWEAPPDGWTARLTLKEADGPRWRDYGYTERHLRSEFHQSDLFLVAELDGRIAGFCNGHHAHWNNTFFVHNLIVDGPARGRGIGTEFLEHVARYARKRNIRAVVLETQADNVTAVRFYRRRGFRLSGFRDDLYSNRDAARHQVALYMSLSLQAEPSGEHLRGTEGEGE